jgi:hypothetical protein
MVFMNKLQLGTQLVMIEEASIFVGIENKADIENFA